MSGSINRTPCPGCGMINNLYISVEFVAQPIGSFSLAGMQMKVSGRERPVLKCRNCDFNLPGEYDGDNHAVFSPGGKPSDTPAPDTTDAPAS